MARAKKKDGQQIQTNPQELARGLQRRAGSTAEDEDRDRETEEPRYTPSGQALPSQNVGRAVPNNPGIDSRKR